jgi:hypothetical protein
MVTFGARVRPRSSGRFVLKFGVKQSDMCVAGRSTVHLGGRLVAHITKGKIRNTTYYFSKVPGSEEIGRDEKTENPKTR